jgi:hypothetical protein
MLDRTQEHLGASDVGVIKFRKDLFKQAEVVAAGGDPIGVIRDPASNERIVVPGSRRGYGVEEEGFPALFEAGRDCAPLLPTFLPFGVPKEISDDVCETMNALVAGLDESWLKRWQK